MRQLRWVVFWALYALVSAFWFLLTAAGELVRPGTIGWTAQRWSAAFRQLARSVLGVRLQLAGTAPDTPSVIAARHESFYEALGLLDVLHNPAVVLKAELLAVPFWHWFARANGAMALDRDAGPAAMRRLIAGARAAAAAGRHILIFPEGTRALPGEWLPVQPGVSALATLLRLPVVPVALRAGHVWPRDGAARPGTVRLRFGEPIPPGLPREEFETRLAAALREEP
jgi:1-acyl-sn-glycerol-3-phosphate acyltransferase